MINTTRLSPFSRLRNKNRQDQSPLFHKLKEANYKILLFLTTTYRSSSNQFLALSEL
jgi:hypothetical protein